MAVISNIPGERQPNDSEHLDESNAKGFSCRFKGLYSALQAKANGLRQGDTFEGNALKAWTLDRAPGDLGYLTLTFAADAGIGEGGSQNPLKVTWSVKSVRNDKSILAYCGESEGNNPYRPHIELWMKETDPDAIEANQYTGPDGEKHPLTELDKLITEKIKKGIESVIRFYPLVSRKRIYSVDPQDSFTKLGFIDSLPTGAPTVTGDYQWLKVQDDKEEQSNGDFVRTESWMGALVSEGGWDADLYGSSRWPMPKGNS